MSSKSLVYKYRTWSDKNHRKVLTENQLFFASPSQINDPFDCKISMDLRLLNTAEKKVAYLNECMQAAKVKFSMNEEAAANVRTRVAWELDNDIDGMQTRYDKVNHQSSDNQFGIISLSQRWDSVLMWSHYAENHQGFCVGFNAHTLVEVLQPAAADAVRYEDAYPPIYPLGDVLNEMLMTMLTKAKDWGYEKEYRLTQLWTGMTPTKEDRIVTIPNDAITEVIIGLCMNDNDAKEIIEIAERKKIPVFKITRQRNSFVLEKKRL